MAGRTFGALVVEDEYLVAIEMVDTLSSAGAEVFGPFSRLGSALEAARANHVDVALVDLRLGDELAFRLIDELESRGAAIMLITAMEPRQLPSRYRSLPLLKKPFRSRSLQERLTTMVHGLDPGRAFSPDRLDGGREPQQDLGIKR